jgi:hypothetical protein
MRRPWQPLLLALILAAASAAPAAQGDVASSANSGRQIDTLPSPDWQLQELRRSIDGIALLPDPGADPWSGGLVLTGQPRSYPARLWAFWTWPQLARPLPLLRQALAESTPPIRRVLLASLAGTLFQAQDRRIESGLAYCAAGFAAAGLGQRELTAQLLDLSIPTLTAERSWYPAAVCSLRQAENHMVRSQLAEAALTFESAANLAERSQLRRARALTRNGLGLLAHRQGELDIAANHYRAAASIWAQLGDHIEAFKIEHNLGGICYVALDVSCAETRFRSALALSEGAPGIDRLRANTFLALARLLAQVGRPREALNYYVEATGAYTDHSPDNAHEAEGLGRAWQGLAQTYQGLGELGRAQALGRRALRLFADVGHVAEANQARVALAAIERDLGNMAQASELLAELIDSAQAEPYALAAAMIEMASIHASTAPDQSAAWLQRAQAQAPPGSRLSYYWWRARAKSLAGQQQMDAAFAALDQARQAARHAANLTDEIDTQLERIDLLIQAGNTQAAEQAIALGQDLLRRLQGQVYGEDLLRSWGLLRRRLTELQVDLAFSGLDDATAGVALLQQLDAESHSALNNHPVNEADSSSVEILQSLRLLRQRLASAPAEARSSMLEEAHSLETRLAAYRRAPDRPVATQSAAIELPVGVTALRFYLSDRAIYRWTVRSEGVGLHRIERNQALDSLLAGYSDSLRRADSAPNAAAIRLGELLLGQLDLDSTARLVLIPDGPLWQVPFAALKLPAGGSFLIEIAAVEYAPSLASISLTEPSLQIASMAIFADPALDRGIDPELGPLAQSRVEAETVASLFPFVPTTALGAQATGARFLTALADSPDVVHYSGHGSFDFSVPELGGLWLAAEASGQSGYLHFSRLREIRSSTSLVVLNGCGTGVSPIHRSAGALGFAREFHAAGVRSVVSTMWAVSDTAAAAMSKGFYQRLRDGAEPSSALRLAQLDLLRSPRFRHPFYWAGYRLDSAEPGAHRPRPD